MNEKHARPCHYLPTVVSCLRPRRDRCVLLLVLLLFLSQSISQVDWQVVSSLSDIYCTRSLAAVAPSLAPLSVISSYVVHSQAFHSQLIQKSGGPCGGAGSKFNSIPFLLRVICSIGR